MAAEEGFVCCWISHIVEATICFSKLYLGYGEKRHVTTDAFAETFEDRYFQVLYELFFIDKKQQPLGSLEEDDE